MSLRAIRPVGTCAVTALWMLALTLLLTKPSSAAPRRDVKTETRSGTIVEVQQKGRARVLVVEIDGEQREVPVTPRVEIEVQAPGDAGFVRPGQFLTARATLSNDRLFIQALTIHPVRRGQKPPPGRIEKAPEEAGQSTMGYLVSGPIAAVQPNKDYPDHTDVLLRTAGPGAPLMLEPGFSVTVDSSDPDLIPGNSPAQIEIAPLRGGRYNVVKVSVVLSEPFTAAEFFNDEKVKAGTDAEEKPKADAAASPSDE